MLGLLLLYFVVHIITFASCWEVFETKLKDQVKENPFFKGLV